MEDKFNITLKIAGTSIYPTIERVEEEAYRQAEREVNRLVISLRSGWRASETEYLSMAALMMAVTAVKRRMEGSVNDDVDALKEIEKKLTDHLLQTEGAELK